NVLDGRIGRAPGPRGGRWPRASAARRARRARGGQDRRPDQCGRDAPAGRRGATDGVATARPSRPRTVGRTAPGRLTTMTTKTFPVFDCDSHVVEPPEIWDRYVPAKVRTWVKTQFHFHTDTDLLCINGRVVPAARERSNAAEVGWPRWDKKTIGKLTPG